MYGYAVNSQTRDGAGLLPSRSPRGSAAGAALDSSCTAYPAMIPNIINSAKKVLQACLRVKRGAVCDQTDRITAMIDLGELPRIPVPSVTPSVSDETFFSKTENIS